METTEGKTRISEVHIPVPWGHISGRWYGNQMERPILALHGWQDNCGTFAKVAPLIVPYRSLLCVDLPGHGESSHLPVGIIYHTMEFVRVIMRIMQAYKWKKVSLMGHSLGGAAAFYFASIFPDRVDMLIGLDTIKNYYWRPDLKPTIFQHIIEKTLIDNDRLVQGNPVEPPSYTFVDCVKLLHEGSQKSVEMDNCKFILDRNIRKSQLFPDKYYFSRDSRIKSLVQFNPNIEITLKMAQRICEASVPYLVLKGGASTHVSNRPTELDDYLKLNNTKFECHIYPRGTHHLHLNNAEPVAQLIIGFLKKHDSVLQSNLVQAKL